MKEKINILMICSWLDHEKGLGSFFVDQAVTLSVNFNFILINFRKQKFNLRNLSQIFKIESHFYSNSIRIYYINIPSIKLFKNTFFDRIIENKATDLLFKKLKFENFRINLVHAQSTFDASFWAYHISVKYKLPYIITEHNQFTLRNIKKSQIKKIHKVFQNSKFNLVVSDDLIRQFATNGFFFDFVNIGNNINENLFFPDLHHKPKKFEIITIGAYTPVKDQLTLLNSIKKLDDTDLKNIKFTWIGINSWGSNESKNVQNLIKSFCFHNIEIDIIEIASKEIIIERLKKSSLFITTSICETFGISALEAISLGIPVIATQSGGVNEFINEKMGSWLK